MRRLPPRQRFHSSFPQVSLNVAPFAANRSQVELVRAMTRNHDEVHPGRKQVRPKTEALAANPLDAVALNGVAHLTTDDETETRRTSRRVEDALPYALRRFIGFLSGDSGSCIGFTGRLRRDKQRKMRSHDAPTELLGSDELGVAAEPSIRPERKRHPPRRSYFL